MSSLHVETAEYRSRVMRQVRSKDTSPEVRVRSLIHRAGYRFRLHVKGMAGKPDIVMPRHKTVVFVNGCFWHRHPGCRYASTPKANAEYWQRKFEGNVARDEKVQAVLRDNGWNVLVIWECQTRDSTVLESLLADLLPPLIQETAGVGVTEWPPTQEA